MSSLAKQLEETINNPDNFQPNKLNLLIGETMNILYSLQSKIQSANPQEREEAIQIGTELKEILEKRAEALCKEIGMNPDELAQFSLNPTNFSAEENRAIQQIAEDFTQFKNEMSPVEKKKKKPIAWIHG